MNTCTLERLTEVMAHYRLCPGSHIQSSHEGCINELYSVCLGVPWTDDPEEIRTWDFRGINDIPVRDSLRDEWMPRVMVAYAGSLNWPREKAARIAKQIVIGTVQRMLPLLTGLSPTASAKFALCATLTEAKQEIQGVLRERRESFNPRGQDGIARDSVRAMTLAKLAVGAAGRALDRPEIAQKATNEAARVVVQVVKEVRAAGVRAARKAAQEAVEAVEAWEAAWVSWEIRRDKIFVEACEIWIEAAEVKDKDE